MENDFWIQKWASQQIGFHLSDAHPLLVKYWPKLEGQSHSQVLVPLCGKSEDLSWLALKHDSVCGVELSDIAVRAFFAERFYTPTVTKISSSHDLYEFDEFSIYCGDFFSAPLTPVDIIYDRAALIAIEPSMRSAYVERQCRLLKPGGKILLITAADADGAAEKPPYRLEESDLNALFQNLSVRYLGRESMTYTTVSGDHRESLDDAWLITSP